MEHQVYAAGTVIFHEGDSGDAMYVIRKGRVGIFVHYGTESEEKLTELEAGRCFGEMGVIDAAPRSADAVALEETETDVICADGLGAYFSENPEQMMELLHHLSGRLRTMTASYIDACGTIRELESGGAKTPSLKEKIRRFIADYNKNQMLLASYGIPNNQYYY